MPPSARNAVGTLLAVSPRRPWRRAGVTQATAVPPTVSRVSDGALFDESVGRDPRSDTWTVPELSLHVGRLLGRCVPRRRVGRRPDPQPQPLRQRPRLLPARRAVPGRPAAQDPAGGHAARSRAHPRQRPDQAGRRRRAHGGRHRGADPGPGPLVRAAGHAPAADARHRSRRTRSAASRPTRTGRSPRWPPRGCSTATAGCRSRACRCASASSPASAPPPTPT